MVRIGVDKQAKDTSPCKCIVLRRGYEQRIPALRLVATGMPLKAVILAPGKFASFGGKTANDLVLYNGRFFDVVAIIDDSKAGRTSKDFLPASKTDCPIVSNLKEALLYEPESLVIGIAPIGGRLTEEYRRVVKEAVRKGIDVWSGMHTFVSDDPEISRLAEKTGAKLHDLRRPPRDLRIWNGEVLSTRAARVTIMGTDCDVGKNVTTLELARSAEQAGFHPGIVATGQTMLMLGTDSGAVIDAIPADFTPGEVEKHVLQVNRMGKNPVFVEGQAAILHPGYGQVSLAILYGSQPHAVCLAHDPFRRKRGGFDAKIPPIEQEISAIERLCPLTKVVAVSVMGWNRESTDIEHAAQNVETQTGLPTGDAMRDGPKLFDAIRKRLKETGKITQ